MEELGNEEGDLMDMTAEERLAIQCILFRSKGSANVRVSFEQIGERVEGGSSAARSILEKFSEQFPDYIKCDAGGAWLTSDGARWARNIDV